ncbi:DNA methyltransferase 3 isoform X3 [Anoplolepis gracilipes]|uniref:DNA methyltransferase 3 isoform X3 n=1 Tax=Anoplolepis gracilipes TaxID=354296 RepID=UPI003B9DDE57
MPAIISITTACTCQGVYLEADVAGLHCAVMQQQKYQESDRVKRRSLRSNKVMSAWSLVCAIELGLLQKSSLKDVAILSYLDFLHTTKKNAQRSFDLETNNHENVVSNGISVSIFGGSWPFIDPAQITQITSRKSVRKLSKKGTWLTKRQRKPNFDSTRWDINHAMTNLSIKRAASSSLRESRRENLRVSNGPTGLSENKFSLLQLDTLSNRERLSGRFGSADEDESVCQAASETDSIEISPIPQIDYSGAGYSRFYTQSCQKKKLRKNRTELPEYPDYFSNVLRIDDNNTEDDDFDTTSDENNYNKQSAKFTKHVPQINNEINTCKSVKNGNTLGHRRRSWKKKNHHLSSENHLKTKKKRRNKMVRRKEEFENSVANNDNLSQISLDSENSLECNSKWKDDSAVDTHDTTKIVQKRYNTRGHSNDFTNAICARKRNLKRTSKAIMQDIQAHIHSTEIVKNIEDILHLFDSSDEQPDDKDLNRDFNRDISMEYDWIELENNGELDNGEITSQKSEQLSDPTESLSNVWKRRGRPKKLGDTIDCNFVDKTETAYRSVFHECVNFDSPVATSSLKINMDESWRSEDNDSGVEMIHSSWRRSVSFTEECDNEFDSALLLARKIVSDDSVKEKYYDDDTLESICYKYDETSDVEIINRDTSFNDSASDEDTKFINQQPKTNIITYNRKSNICKQPSMDGFIGCNLIKNRNGKVRVLTNEKINYTVTLLGRNPSDQGADLECDSDKKQYLLRRITRALAKTSKQNQAGKLVWGKCQGWWPGVIVDAEHVGMLPTSGKLWVYWIGESQISLLKEETQIQPFSSNLEHRLTQPSRTKSIRSRAIDTTMQMLRQRFDCTLTKPYYFWIQRNIAEFESLDDLIFYPYPQNMQERLNTLKEMNIKAEKKACQRNSLETLPVKKQVEKSKDINTSWKQIEDERLPLQDQHPGVIAWAKIAGHNWWPGMIIDYRDACLKEPSFGCQWVMWYGDYQISEIRHLEFLKFNKGLEKMRDFVQNTMKQYYAEGVLQASKDYCSRLGCSTDNWTLDNVFEYFSNTDNIHVPYNQLQVSDSNKIYDKYSAEITKKINEIKSKPDVDAVRKKNIKTSDALCRVISGECAVEKLCLKCLTFPKDEIEEHPFFIGSLCKDCSHAYKPCMFVYGNDGKCFYCTICAGSGTVLICDADDCPRVYCTACLKFLICPKSYEDILLEDPWKCFLCRDESKQPTNVLLRPRLNWKENLSTMFRTATNPALNDVNFVKYTKEKKPIRVLSLFDGLSTGFVVLLNLGIAVDVYYASEIDKNALMISSSHFGDRITYLGDVRNITKEKLDEIAPIDLLIGGSPCNDLSMVNPARLGLHDPRSTGILFFEYCRIKKLMKKANKHHHLFWLFENVASMPTEYRLEINKHLGQEPYVIDSADFSPQRRLRLYWHNFPFNPYLPLFHNQQDVQDKLTPNLNRKALCKKLRTVTSRSNSLLQGKMEEKPILMMGESDKLWITELEEIFGFPRHYTDVNNLSATNRQKLLGKSWSVQTLTAILRPLCFYFKCKEDETSNNISALHEDISPLYRDKHV